MQLLHETPVLSRAAIRDALGTLPEPAPLDVSILPPALHAISASDLAEQVELIKITPTAMSTEEMSKLWSALMTHYRPTATYHISVVLIESAKQTRVPLPVLSRGAPIDDRDQGPIVQLGLTLPTPHSPKSGCRTTGPVHIWETKSYSREPIFREQ